MDSQRGGQEQYINPLEKHIPRITGLWDMHENQDDCTLGFQESFPVKDEQDLGDVLHGIPPFSNLRQEMGDTAYFAALQNVYERVIAGGGIKVFYETMLRQRQADQQAQ